MDTGQTLSTAPGHKYYIEARIMYFDSCILFYKDSDFNDSNTILYVSTQNNKCTKDQLFSQFRLILEYYRPRLKLVSKRNTFINFFNIQCNIM